MKEFYKVLVDYFSASRKASWKKQEVVSKIKDLYINEMEKKNERTNRPRVIGSLYDGLTRPTIYPPNPRVKDGVLRDPYEPE